MSRAALAVFVTALLAAPATAAVQPDGTQWSIAPYTEADLQKQIDRADDLYGALGVGVFVQGPGDPDPGSVRETLTALLSVHGIVYARAGR